MSSVEFADKLDAAADRIADLDRSEMHTLLRRSALRLRNTQQVPLDPEWEDALRSVADEMGLTRNDLIRVIVKDWLETNAYLPVHMLDEDTEMDGSA